IARHERLDGELPGQPFVDLDAVLDNDAVGPGLQKIMNRQPSAALSQRRHDPAGTNLLDDVAEVPAGTQKQVTRDNWVRRQDVIDYTDDLTMLPSFKLRNQGLSQRRGSQNQHAIEEQAALHDSIGRGPDEQQQTSRGE